VKVVRIGEWRRRIMGAWQVMFWVAAVVVAFAGLYRLHRLGLWAEERGYIYYLRKKPRGSAAGALVALQRAIEPQARHVLVVREQADREAADPGAPDLPPGPLDDPPPRPVDHSSD
jgi:hypothetical protein